MVIQNESQMRSCHVCPISVANEENLETTGIALFRAKMSLKLNMKFLNLFCHKFIISISHS